MGSKDCRSLLAWHSLQSLTFRSTMLSIPWNHTRERMRRFVFTIPWCCELDDSLSHTDRNKDASISEDDSLLDDAQLVDERSVVGQLLLIYFLSSLSSGSTPVLLAICSRVKAGSKALWTMRLMYCSIFFSSRYAATPRAPGHSSVVVSNDLVARPMEDLKIELCKPECPPLDPSWRLGLGVSVDEHYCTIVHDDPEAMSDEEDGDPFANARQFLKPPYPLGCSAIRRRCPCAALCTVRIPHAWWW